MFSLNAFSDKLGLATEPTAYVNGFMGLNIMIDVVEDKNNITISGVNAKAFFVDIENRWKTSRIWKNMFIQFRMRSFTFPKFYALEVAYMLNELLQSKRRQNISKSSYTKMLRLLNENTWYGQSDNNPPIRINKAAWRDLKVTPSAKQEEFVETFAREVPKDQAKGLLLHGDAGVGKTLACCFFSYAMDADYTIVLAPKQTMDEVWLSTFRNQNKENFQPDRLPEFWNSINQGNFTGTEKFIVVHYEAMASAFEYIRKFPKRKFTLWVDESHNFNDSKSARTKLMVELGTTPQCKYYVPASGTPFKAMGAEAVPFLRINYPMFTDKCAEIYTKAFGAAGQFAYDIVENRITRVKFRIERRGEDIPPLQEYMYTLRFKGAENYTLENVRRVMAQEATNIGAKLKDERPMVIEEFNRLFYMVYKEQDPEAQAQYRLYKARVDEMHDKFDPMAHREVMPWCTKFEEDNIIPQLPVAERKLFRYVKGRYKYEVLVLRGILLGTVFLQMRIDCFSDMFKYAQVQRFIEEAEKKTLIFSSYIDILKFAEGHLKDLGYKTLVLSADTKESTSQAVQMFSDDPALNPLLSTYKTLGTGVPVLAANVIIMVDPPYRDYIREQAIARARRRDQTHTVHAIEFKLDTGNEPNLSTRGIDILKFTKEAVDKILGTNVIDEDDEKVTQLSFNEAFSQEDNLATDLYNKFRGFIDGLVR